MPTVSVLLPVYNGEKFLGEAINSILAQTYEDFRLVILNDGSSDGSAQIIDSYDDPRIQTIHQPENLGLTETLNRAIDSNLDTPYLARMDQDDVSLPDRLAKQVAYMEAHPNTGMLATNVRFINEQGEHIHGAKYQNGLSGTYLYWRLHWENPIIHSSVMLRNSVLKEYRFRYVAGHYPGDDYHLWLQMKQSKVRFGLLDDVCLNYRYISGSISRLSKDNQLRLLFGMIQKQVDDLLNGRYSTIALETLAAHFSEQTLSAYDYAGAARIHARVALWYLHRADNRLDRARIFYETDQLLQEFSAITENQSKQQIQFTHKLFSVYVRHISKFTRRLPIWSDLV